MNSPFERVPQHATDPGFGPVPPESNVRYLSEIPNDATPDYDALCKEVARCHARLEIDHYFVSEDGQEPTRVEVPYAKRLHQIDGISCRDETIKMLEAATAPSNHRDAERYRFIRSIKGTRFMDFYGERLDEEIDAALKDQDHE